MAGNLGIFNLLHSQRIVGTCRGADHQIALWQKLQSLSIIDPVAALRYGNDPASVLTHSNRYICSCLFQGQSRNLSHFSVPDDHTGFSLNRKSLIFQPFYGLVDHRTVGSGKTYLGLYFFSRGDSHAEQHFQYVVRTVSLSGKGQGVLYLGNDLVLRKDLGFQAAGEIKQMFHSLLFFPFHKILFKFPGIFLLLFT